MNLKTFVKVGNISNLSDARYCAGYGVNLLGFNIDPAQDGAIDLEKAKEIIGWVSVEGIILEAGSLDTQKIEEIKQLSDVNYYQVDTLTVANQLVAKDIACILRILVDSEEQISRLDSSLFNASTDIKFVLFECHDQSLFEKLYQAIDQLDLDIPAIKAFDVEVDNLDAVIDKHSLYAGIGLNGSEEEQAGFKDYDELADILEVLEIDD